ncbi:MAG: radical SAM protein [Candidatus Omnitrophica bacterium]|nr:radical SAM protein [Candidatus Omnitrophota bacterium]MDD5610145.1 radical SAM protein [Candidatus Omnitrophota bacterium]
MMLFPPIGLEYVATSAKGLVDKITLLDLRYEKELADIEDLLDFIRKEVDVVCVGIGWDRQFEEICQLLNRMPAHIPQILGGYTATEKVNEFFQACPNVSIIVRGEGEETIREILQGSPLKNILGISYQENGRIIHNPNRPFPNVDTLNPPDRSLRRNKYALSVNGIQMANITFDAVLSARGCPFNCKFCTFSLNPLGQKRDYAARNVESVVNEIQGLEAGVIMFSDDNLFTEPKRAEKICDLIIARKIKKRFIAQARIDIAKYPQLLEKMVKAGFKALLLGIESPHDWILKQLNKGFDQKTIREAFAVLRKYPIFYNGYFIYGNIGETEKEMLYIGQFAKEIGVDSISCNKLRIEKFSPLRELAEKTPGYHITERGELYSDTFSHAALKKIGKRIKFSFYTPSRYLKIFWKNIFVVKFFTFKEAVALIFTSPRLVARVLIKEQKRGRLKDSLKRTFIENK